MFKLVTSLRAATNDPNSVGVCVLIVAVVLFGISFLVKIFFPEFFFPITVLIVAATWVVVIWDFLRFFRGR